MTQKLRTQFNGVTAFHCSLMTFVHVCDEVISSAISVDDHRHARCDFFGFLRGEINGALFLEERKKRDSLTDTTESEGDTHRDRERHIDLGRQTETETDTDRQRR